MKRLIPLLSILILAISLHALPPRKVIRIPQPDQTLFETMLNSGADIASYRPGLYLDLVVNDVEYARLREKHPDCWVTQTEEALRSNLSQNRDIPGYRTYAEVVAELMQLQALYPSLMQTSSLGTGWGSIYADQGFPAYQSFDHQLWAVKVSANVQASEDEPKFFFVGEHHAREPISTEVCMGILIHLLENYGSDPIVTNIMNTAEIWIVPLLNPDGHKIVLDQTDVWWRKNIRDNDNNLSFDYDDWGYGNDGADLNRNYGYYWGYTSASDNIDEPTYHGLAPFSEPETQAFRDLLLSQRFLAGIGYHTYGEYVLYPYGFVNGISAPDQIELQALANEIATQLPALDGGNYAPGPSYGLYPVSGSLDDWAYGQTGAFSYTIEMAQEFIPSASQIPQIVPHQINGAMTLLQRQYKKILRGHVTDALTGTPLPARIFVQGIDDQPVYRAPIYADSLYGSYYYFLSPGAYTVTYFYPGYQAEVNQVTIHADQPTVFDIALLPADAYELSIEVQDDFFDPLPGVTLNIPTLTGQTFISDEFGLIVIPDFHAGIHQLIASKPEFETLDYTRHISSTSITLRLTGQALLTEDFELNLQNWAMTGNWARTSNQHYEGAYSLADSPSGNYQNNGSSYCKLNTPLNLSNFSNANLQFWLKTALALDEDCLILESSPTGANWQIMDFYTGTTDWTLKSYSLNSFLGQSLYLRFRMSTGSWGSADGVYIDDLKLFGNADPSLAEDVPQPGQTLKLMVGPNPFAEQCTIRVKVPRELQYGELAIYNLRGQQVRSYALMDIKNGEAALIWNGKDSKGQPCSAGVYLARLTASDGRQARAKLLLIK